VHPAADGGLARVRLPGGRTTIGALAELLACSLEYGDGRLELTSRGNVQLRGLHESAGPLLHERLASVGLLPSMRHERVRNFVASPASGILSGGHIDLTGLLAELDEALCAEEKLAALSGRFLFGLDDGRGDVVGMEADVAVRFVDPKTAELWLAGVPTGQLLPVESITGTMLQVARNFVDRAAGQAPAAWRLRDIPYSIERIVAELAVDGFGTTLPASRTDVGPDGRSGAPDGPGGAPDSPRHPAGPPQPGPLEPGRYRQLDGSVCAIVSARFGRLETVQARALLHDRAAHARVIVTPWRSVLVPDLASPHAEALLARAHASGLGTDATEPWRHVTACIGSPGCARSHADVRATAIALSTPVPLPAMPVHWVGCERACGTPTGAHLRVQAGPDGYRVGGDQTPVPASRIQNRITELAAAATATDEGVATVGERGVAVRVSIG
jgi:precorrin-3B synthase